MKRILSLNAVAWVLVLSACVTINVYFPAVAAEQAADTIIRDVWSDSEAPGAPEGANGAALDPRPLTVRVASVVLDFLVSPAAAAQPRIDISSPAVQRLTRSMEQRYSELKPYFESGAIGLTDDALIAIRSLERVPLSERNRLRRLVAEENADRNALYREIAVANGHPEWEDEIRETFARRWIANAPGGWYYQDGDGQWQRK